MARDTATHNHRKRHRPSTWTGEPKRYEGAWTCSACKQEVFIRPDHHAYVCSEYLKQIHAMEAIGEAVNRPGGYTKAFVEEYQDTGAPLSDMAYRKRRRKK